MKCPACGDTRLTLAERQGIEIDYCPDCRGVWLDRGELDKLIERGGGGRDHDRPSTTAQDEPESRPDRSSGRRGRRESLLGDLFDFG